MIKRLTIAALLLVLAACSRPSFQGADLTGAPIGGDFTLTAHTGKPVKLADYQGKVVALFFGYTSCPDVCPTTMFELKSAMKLLGARADQVQVLFVTVDPVRDTPELLREYVPAFDPRFVGLTGSPKQIAEVARLYKVVYQQQGQGSSYTVDHTAGTYLFDRSGKPRVLVQYGAGGPALAHDLGVLLDE
ncbi:SCO family protein [Chitinibacteraceae bacterium HSL-7]